MQETDTDTDPPAVGYELLYWDIMEAEHAVPRNWTRTEEAPRASGFRIASRDEDLVENVPTLEEFIQLRDFIQQETNRPVAPDFTAALYHPTMPHEIRVLKLAPGRYQQPLIAALEHISVEFAYAPVEKSVRRSTTFGVSLSKKIKVPYTAISYCWGTGDFVCPIKVSGHDMTITKTLDDILRHLRSENETVTVWVDQLCIDQTSKSDKESQVKLMNSVYTRARNTIIWLGKEAGGEAFKALRKLARDTAGIQLEMTGERLDALRRPSGIWADYAQGMKDLRALLLQPWFQRTWVIQEAVLSLDVYFMAGYDTISWDDFAGHCLEIVEYGIFDDEVGTQANRIRGRMSGLDVAAKIYIRKTHILILDSGGPHRCSIGSLKHDTHM